MVKNFTKCMSIVVTASMVLSSVPVYAATEQTDEIQVIPETGRDERQDEEMEAGLNQNQGIMLLSDEGETVKSGDGWSIDGTVLVFETNAGITDYQQFCGEDDWYSKNITEVHFEDVSLVDTNTLVDMLALERVEFSKNVESYGNNVISGCTKLTTIKFENKTASGLSSTNFLSNIAYLQKVEIPSTSEVRSLYEKVLPSTVEIIQPEITSVALSKVPTKTTYNDGEYFEADGLGVTITYEDEGTEEVLYNKSNAGDFGFSTSQSGPFKASVSISEGIDAIYGSYLDNVFKVVSVKDGEIYDENSEPKLEARIVSAPRKTDYYVGEAPVLDGGFVVTVLAGDLEVTTITWSKSTASNFEILTKEITKDTKEISVDVMGAVCSYPIHVLDNSIYSISVDKAPVTTIYYGNQLSLIGMKINVLYSNSTRDTVEYTLETANHFDTKFDDNPFEIGEHSCSITYTDDAGLDGIFQLKYEVCENGVKYREVKGLQVSDIANKVFYFGNQEVKDILPTMDDVNIMKVVHVTYENGYEEDIVQDIEENDIIELQLPEALVTGVNTGTVKLSIGMSEFTGTFKFNATRNIEADKCPTSVVAVYKGSGVIEGLAPDKNDMEVTVTSTITYKSGAKTEIQEVVTDYDITEFTTYVGDSSCTIRYTYDGVSVSTVCQYEGIAKSKVSSKVVGINIAYNGPKDIDDTYKLSAKDFNITTDNVVTYNNGTVETLYGNEISEDAYTLEYPAFIPGAMYTVTVKLKADTSIKSSTQFYIKASGETSRELTEIKAQLNAGIEVVEGSELSKDMFTVKALVKVNYETKEPETVTSEILDFTLSYAEIKVGKNAVSILYTLDDVTKITTVDITAKEKSVVSKNLNSATFTYGDDGVVLIPGELDVTKLKGQGSFTEIYDNGTAAEVFEDIPVELCKFGDVTLVSGEFTAPVIVTLENGQTCTSHVNLIGTYRKVDHIKTTAVHARYTGKMPYANTEISREDFEVYVEYTVFYEGGYEEKGENYLESDEFTLSTTTVALGGNEIVVTVEIEGEGTLDCTVTVTARENPLGDATVLNITDYRVKYISGYRPAGSVITPSDVEVYVEGELTHPDSSVDTVAIDVSADDLIIDNHVLVDGLNEITMHLSFDGVSVNNNTITLKYEVTEKPKDPDEYVDPVVQVFGQEQVTGLEIISSHIIYSNACLAGDVLDKSDFTIDVAIGAYNSMQEYITGRLTLKPSQFNLSQSVLDAGTNVIYVNLITDYEIDRVDTIKITLITPEEDKDDGGDDGDEGGKGDEGNDPVNPDDPKPPVNPEPSKPEDSGSNSGGHSSGGHSSGGHSSKGGGGGGSSSSSSTTKVKPQAKKTTMDSVSINGKKASTWTEIAAGIISAPPVGTNNNVTSPVVGVNVANMVNQTIPKVAIDSVIGTDKMLQISTGDGVSVVFIGNQIKSAVSTDTNLSNTCTLTTSGNTKLWNVNFAAPQNLGYNVFITMALPQVVPGQPVDVYYFSPDGKPMVYAAGIPANADGAIALPTQVLGNFVFVY